MTLDEALAWLSGLRSMTNILPYGGDPLAHQVAIATADAAMTQQAYWVAKAAADGLLPTHDDRNLHEGSE